MITKARIEDKRRMIKVIVNLIISKFYPMVVFNKHLELKGITDIKDILIKKGILTE